MPGRKSSEGQGWEYTLSQDHTIAKASVLVLEATDRQENRTCCSQTPMQGQDRGWKQLTSERF